MDQSERKKLLAFINTLLYETPGGQRYTQDSPILPPVWMRYAAQPHKQQKLILTTYHNAGTGRAAHNIRKMLKVLRSKRPTLGQTGHKREPAKVSYIPGQIAITLYFDEVMRVVLPLTPWWHEQQAILKKLALKYRDKSDTATWELFPQPDKKIEQDLLSALMYMRRQIDPSINHESEDMSEDRLRYIRDVPPDLAWMVRIAGLIGGCFDSGHYLLSDENSVSSRLNKDFISRRDNQDELYGLEEQTDTDPLDDKEAAKVRREIVKSFVGIYDNWCPVGEYPDEQLIWRVTINRPIHLAVSKSSLTVKADAARRLFNISCRDITWAIVDSGIDGTHPAFKLTSDIEHENSVRQALADTGDTSGKDINSKLKSRVIKTLDFTRLRELLDVELAFDDDAQGAAPSKGMIELLKQNMPDSLSDEEKDEKASDLLDRLRRRIQNGEEINWQDLKSAIEVSNPEVPINDHGTHVAGILGADWIDESGGEDIPLANRKRKMQGVCPDINLIDVRVFRDDGKTDEFELLAAIQYLRWMNARAGSMQVHGANLSLSLVHEVRRFACGQTPICDECNEASALGMVIVAAAGNRGFELDEFDDIKPNDSYKTVSITDPGNAEKVITVGSTHRKRPHEYGVSYFSSRGPTGDGRIKPDLVAPGEKIKGPTPHSRSEFKDGTSMAAPHVSGAAAMLMARYSELVGQPDRIKTILCETATDLGRERYFQGHGLVDALRALQSV